MSGLEGLGAAAASVGITNAVIATVTALDGISFRTRHALSTVNEITTQLDFERLQFFFWCQDAGFLDNFIAMGSDEQTSVTERHDFPEGMPVEVQESVKELVERLVRSLKNRLEISEPVLLKYTNPKEPSYLRHLRETHTTLASRPRDPLDPLAMLEERHVEPSLDLAKKIWFGIKDKEKLEDLLKLFRETNQSLYQLLGRDKSRNTKRKIAAVLTTTSLASSLVELEDSESFTGSTEQALDEARNLAQLSQLETSGVTGRISRRPAWEIPYLHKADIHFPKGSNEEGASRSFGEYKKSPVLVEWRYYPRGSSTMNLDALASRVRALALQLRQSTKIQGFQLLNCLGHFHDEKDKRFGMVFEYPSACSKQPISLLQLLKNDYDSKGLRDLEDRLRAAVLLTTTMFSLFSVRWLHKNISADNILFFNDQESEYTLSKPHLCGFDFSRTDSPSEFTETLPSRTNESQMAFERRLYKHPDFDRLQHTRAANEQENTPGRYRRAFDVYSLGIVLLEIAYWRPMSKLIRVSEDEKANLDLVRLRQSIIKKYLSGLRSRVGRPYAEVVKRCLDVDFDEEESSSASDAQKTRDFLGRFNELAVSEMEKSLDAKS